jgi:hypothetical protein
MNRLYRKYGVAGRSYEEEDDESQAVLPNEQLELEL